MSHPEFTIAYITGRREPRFEWFIDSLWRQCEGENARIIVVDYYRDERPLLHSHPERILHHVTPKPTVWQGPHRLTKNEYFCAANARNTAICLAPTEWIVFIDDLSVLLPGWASYVTQAISENYIALGSYKKVKQLVVEAGEIKSFEAHPPGVDCRLGLTSEEVTSCAGSWLFGASFACPIQALLDVNGLDEACDSTGMGSEDYCLGIRIGNLSKYGFRYDRRMMTYESEEDHGVENRFLRQDKGVSPNDKSHAMLNQALASNRAENAHLGLDGLAGLRQRVLAGEPFPVPTEPTTDWFDGQPLSEL